MANVRKFLTLALLAIGIQWSCVKDPQDIPSGIADNPVFGLSGTLEGQPIFIEAGTNGWTMLPVVAEADSLTQYKAVLSKDGCLDQCSSSWEFIVYQPLNASSVASQAFTQTIHPGEKLFVPSASERTSYNISLSSHPGLFMSGLTYWENLNDSSTNYMHDYQSNVAIGEDMYVCFQALGFTGCQYSQCLYFNPATEVPCLAYIEPFLENARFLSLNVRPQGTGPFSFLWSNGSTSSIAVIPLQDTVATIYADVKVTDANGNRSELSQTIKVLNGSLDACYFPVSLTSELVQDGSPSVFAGRVEVKYTDPDGQIWTSSGGIQTDQPEWSIEKVASFGSSPTTQVAYQVEVSTKVRLYNVTTGESMLLNTERLSLAFGHD